MKRREFITLLGSAAAWPLAAHAQQRERVRRIGIMTGYAQSLPRDLSARTASVMRKGRTTMRNRDLAKLVAGPLLAIAPSILAASAQPLPPTSPPLAAFGAQWKHMDVKIVEGPDGHDPGL